MDNASPFQAAWQWRKFAICHLLALPGARLQYQQAVELERAAEQRGRREHLPEQLRDRFRIGMFGQHFAVAALEIDHLAAHVGIVEKETLALI